MPYQAMFRIHYKSHEETRQQVSSPPLLHPYLTFSYPCQHLLHHSPILPFQNIPLQLPIKLKSQPLPPNPLPLASLTTPLHVDLIQNSRPPRSRTARAIHILRPRMLRNLYAKTLMPGIVSRKVAVAQGFGDDVAAFRVLEVFVVAHVD